MVTYLPTQYLFTAVIQFIRQPFCQAFFNTYINSCNYRQTDLIIRKYIVIQHELGDRVYYDKNL